MASPAWEALTASASDAASSAVAAATARSTSCDSQWSRVFDRCSASITYTEGQSLYNSRAMLIVHEGHCNQQHLCNAYTSRAEAS